MSRKRFFAVLSSLAIVVLLVGISSGGGVASGANVTPGAVLRHITVAPAVSVNASAAAAAAKGFKPSVPSRPAMTVGAPLPALPAWGSKSVSKATPSAPRPLNSTTNSFDGVNEAGSNCSCQPPDVNATVGDGLVVEAVNLEFAVYNASTGSNVLSVSLNDLVGTADGLADPRVVFDPTWNRWELSFADVSSPTLWLLYSQTSDPTGGWWIYHIGIGLGAGSLMDYPMVGMDQNSFVYTTNNFDSTPAYISSTAFDVSKARVYNGFGWTVPLFTVPDNTAPAIVGGHPTQTADNLYMLSPDDAGNVMNVYYLSATGSTPHIHFLGAIAYNWGAPPRRVNQPGTSTTLDPLDGRIDWSPTQLDGRVWFAHGVSVAGFPSVNYGWVTPGNMTIHVNNAFHSATSDDFNPAISVENSPAGIPQEWVTWAYTDTAAGTPTRDLYAFNGGTTLAHLVGNQFGGNGNITSEGRFGDYSSSWPEYNANGGCSEGFNAVLANQYFQANGDWGTRIVRVHNGSQCTP